MNKLPVICFSMILFTGAIGALAWSSYNRQVPFNRQGWLLSNSDQPVHNPHMVQDICKIVHHTAKSEVIDILGIPDSLTDAPGEELYYLIRQDWKGIEPAYTVHLVLKLDQITQRVRECGILSYPKGGQKRYEVL